MLCRLRWRSLKNVGLHSGRYFQGHISPHHSVKCKQRSCQENKWPKFCGQLNKDKCNLISGVGIAKMAIVICKLRHCRCFWLCWSYKSKQYFSIIIVMKNSKKNESSKRPVLSVQLQTKLHWKMFLKQKKYFKMYNCGSLLIPMWLLN